ncbi:site-specific integrase [Candidatus Binatus sp.]|uniref:tyrosine-type recombinase/integrase n=1 Tax=Candidatus Binatus sp. TaxID=2811406 RepID=UPI002F94CFAB
MIRESAKTESKTVARDAERARRRELEKSFNRIPKRERMPLFSVAAEQWLATKSPRSEHTVFHYRQYVHSLSAIFGKRLVCDVSADDIAELQERRAKDGLSGRTINAEVGVLRQILKRHRLWNALAENGAVKFKAERRDVGRSISREDEDKLLDAIRQSRSPALLPLFVMAVDTGLRASELRHLRRRDLHLTWANGFIESGTVVVSRSKTEGGTGRMVPLTRRACAVLSLWLSRFPDAGLDSYAFPQHCVGFAGNKRKPALYDLDLTKPIGEWKTAWNVARTAAKLNYRWHDARHTFISRLAENPNVSEQTITALAGHVSKRMLERYSHIRAQAKREAIETLESAGFTGAEAQKWAQSAQSETTESAEQPEKVLN